MRRTPSFAGGTVDGKSALVDATDNRGVIGPTSLAGMNRRRANRYRWRAAQKKEARTTSKTVAQTIPVATTIAVGKLN